jgi:hypothetical protein
MAVTDALPIVQCQGCKEAMVVVEQQPAPNSQELLRIICRCESCDTETTRMVKADRA